MLKKKVSLYVNILYLFLLQAVNYIGPLLILPYLTRILSNEAFGNYILFVTAGQFLAIVVGLGFDLSAPRRVARKSSLNNSYYFTSVTLLKLLALTIFTFAFFQYNLYITHLGKWASISIFLTGLALTFTPIWFFLGLQKMGLITLSGVMTKLLFLVSVFIFVKDDTDQNLLYVMYALSFIIPSVFSMYIVRNQYKIEFKFSRKYLFLTLLDTLPFFNSRLAVSSYTVSSGLIIGTILGPISLAAFAVAEKLYVAAQSLIYPITNSLYPYLSKTRDLDFAKKMLFLSVAIAVLGVFVGFTISEKTIEIIFGSEYIESYKILNVFILTLGFFFPSVILGYPVLAAFGHSNVTNRSVYVGLFSFVVMILLGINGDFFSSIHVARAVLMAELSVLCYRFYYFSKLFLVKR
ncbi:oligosaccharide flippase family protein [Vibrio vulnificus]|uniref:oligosaccharide flippase family protein n=1 Tax=Vibrio vulnificus TaxID=672 RepID=UPI0028DD6791|nr:oligosaccharide flippase family protein [Vibrio vulnificus]MDT8823879.1 oligosaccharide flippase family protein [Vibrio vulnificus]